MRLRHAARRSVDRRFWIGMALIVVLGGALRLAFIAHGLPSVTGADEPVVLHRAQLLLHGEIPTEYDWPTGSMGVLALWLRAGSLIRSSVAATGATPYLYGRILFVAISIATVVLAGVLGSRVADRPSDKRIVGWSAALAIAVAYPSVRLGRQLHPDHLQSAASVAGLLALFRFDRTRATRYVALAGALAGVAGGTKYLGGLLVLPIAASVLLVSGSDIATRAWQLLAAALGFVVAFVVTVPGTLFRFSDVATGISSQFNHQRRGHLGYDHSGTAWWYHFTTSLPGSWGWVFTLAAAVGLVMVAIRGSRFQRLTAAYVAITFLAVGSSTVRFPHYVLVYLPAAAPLAVIAVLRLGRALRTREGIAAGALVLCLVPTFVNDLRLVRANAATDTRALATPFVESLVGPVVRERYTGVSDNETEVFSVGSRPEIVDCKCYVVVSSYMEERYRLEPQRHPREVAVYDALRQRGRVVAVFAPRRPLSYRWDVLPQFGEQDLPLTGPLGPIGPTITVLDLGVERPAG